METEIILPKDQFEMRLALRELSDEELNRLKGQVDAEVMHRATKVFGRGE